jgi:thioesterase domain-containing protein
VCVHDLESDAFLFAPLARRLPEDQPVFALRPPTGERVDRMPRTLESLAARYLDDLAAATAGPYALVGFCFGGVVALEMARLLEARGQPVASLTLVNLTAYDLGDLVSARARRRFRRRWGARIRYLRRKPDAIAWLVRRLGRLLADLGWRVRLVVGRELERGPSATSAGLQRAVLRRAFRNHHPRPHSGDVALFVAEETLPLYADDPREAWAGLATGQIRIERLPHDGYAMLVEPDVARLASHLMD